ncbi:MAG: hypothetical protein EZS28_012164, partial [Streblomastix strix]
WIEARQTRSAKSGSGSGTNTQSGAGKRYFWEMEADILYVNKLVLFRYYAISWEAGKILEIKRIYYAIWTNQIAQITKWKKPDWCKVSSTSRNEMDKLLESFGKEIEPCISAAYKLYFLLRPLQIIIEILEGNHSQFEFVFPLLVQAFNYLNQLLQRDEYKSEY